MLAPLNMRLFCERPDLLGRVKREFTHSAPPNRCTGSFFTSSQFPIRQLPEESMPKTGNF